MNRIFETCSVLMLLVVVPLASAQIPAAPPTPLGLGPKMTISVHDYADVPSKLLSAAEEQAREIYRLAGLETVWLNCSQWYFPKIRRRAFACIALVIH